VGDGAGHEHDVPSSGISPSLPAEAAVEGACRALLVTDLFSETRVLCLPLCSNVDVLGLACFSHPVSHLFPRLAIQR